jgi:hypothetical protein
MVERFGFQTKERLRANVMAFRGRNIVLLKMVQLRPLGRSYVNTSFDFK